MGMRMVGECIVITDNHPAFRNGLTFMLSLRFPKMQILEAGTFDEVLDIARKGAPPDLFVLDVIFPGFCADHSISTLRQEFDRSTIAVISAADDNETVDRVMKAGADSFIAKSVSSEAIGAAIETAHRGETVVLTSTRGVTERRCPTPHPCSRFASTRFWS